MSDEEHTTNDLQALVVGYVMAAVGKMEESGAADFTVEWPEPDEHGVYRPYFDVVGNVTGVRLRVSVAVIE